MSIGKAPAAPWHRVEWRVQGKVDGGGGVRVVPYLDRPTVADLLDDWVGPLGWRDFFEPTGKQGVMWCHMEVHHDERGEWVRKTDVGTASDMESDKGLVSDAFKRVAMGQWGVGRNVYDLPTLRLTAGKFRTYKDSRGNDQAQLTDESSAEIVRLLKAQGFTDAAATVRVEGSEPQEEPAPPPKPAERNARQDAVKTALDGLDAPQKDTLKGLWTDEGLPLDLTALSDEQCDRAMQLVEKVAEVPF